VAQPLRAAPRRFGRTGLNRPRFDKDGLPQGRRHVFPRNRPGGARRPRASAFVGCRQERPGRICRQLRAPTHPARTPVLATFISLSSLATSLLVARTTRVMFSRCPVLPAWRALPRGAECCFGYSATWEGSGPPVL